MTGMSICSNSTLRCSEGKRRLVRQPPLLLLCDRHCRGTILRPIHGIGINLGIKWNSLLLLWLMWRQHLAVAVLWAAVGERRLGVFLAFSFPSVSRLHDANLFMKVEIIRDVIAENALCSSLEFGSCQPKLKAELHSPSDRFSIACSRETSMWRSSVRVCTAQQRSNVCSVTDGITIPSVV